MPRFPFTPGMHRVPSHEALSRRTMLQAGSVGLLGLGMNHVAGLRESDASPSVTAGSSAPGTEKSVIFVFLSGGLGQHDSFDPKPDAPAGIRGEFNPIAAKTPGLFLCEHLPMLAERSQKWSLVRTLTTPWNEHSQGHTSILTGRTPMPPAYNPVKPQSTDWPSIASVVGDVAPRRNNNLPPAIVLPERLVHRSGRTLPGQFGGIMGSRRDPWFVEASPFNANTYGAYPEYEFHFEKGRQHTEGLRFQAPNLTLPQGLDQRRLANRTQLQQLLDRQRGSLERAAATESFDRYRQAAVSLLTDRSVQRAFDVHNAPAKDLDRYGRNSFGWSLLMARQLVEAGVNLIQVNLGNNESWDTHYGNFPMLRECLLPPMDKGMSALLDDLDERGLLGETLILMCGEMGRTPHINARHGRDHWGATQSLLVAGGGTPGGITIGVSDAHGAYPISNPQTPENMAATIYNALGIPSTAAWKDDLGRPHHIYEAEPIRFA